MLLCDMFKCASERWEEYFTFAGDKATHRTDFHIKAFFLKRGDKSLNRRSERFDSQRINLFDLLATDPNKAQVEFKKLIESKRFGGCRAGTDSASTLPSFSAIGG